MVRKFNHLIFLFFLVACGAEKAKIKCNGCALSISAVNAVTFTNIKTDTILANSCSGLISEAATSVAPNGTAFSVATPTNSSAAPSACTTCNVSIPSGELETTDPVQLIDTVSTAQTVTISNSFPSLGQTCSVSIPSITINCSDSSFSVTNANIASTSATSFNVSMDISKFDDQSGSSITSNSVSINRLYINQVSDLQGAGTNDTIDEMFTFNNELFIIADANACVGSAGTLNGTTKKLHKLTATTIAAISDTNPNNDDFVSFPIKKVEFNGKLYLEMVLSTQARLFSFNGSALSYIDDFSGGDDTAITDFASYGSKLYFGAVVDTGTGNYSKLLSLDVNDVVYNVATTTTDLSADDDVNTLIPYSNNLYFDSKNASGAYFQKMFKLSAFAPFAIQVSDTAESTTTADFNSTDLNYIEYDGNIYIVGRNSAGFNKIYKFNGTTFTAFSNTAGNAADDGISNFYIYNGTLYFTAIDSSRGNGTFLFKTDGATITQLPQTSSAGDNDDSPTELFGFDNYLYFSALDANGDRKLFKTDSTDVTQISDIVSGGDDNPEQLISFNSELYFVAYSSGVNKKLFKYDGTQIFQLTNYNTVGSDDITVHLVFDSELYFSMSDGTAKKLFKITIP